MTNITRIPAQDNYSTTLTAKLTASATDLTIYVKVAPTYTPISTATRCIINPGKSNAELVNISSYDSSAKTFTIPASGRAQTLVEGVTATVQEHASGSIIMISDNFKFWEDIQDSVVSKADLAGQEFTGQVSFSGTTHGGIKVNSLTTVQRDALVSPGDGLIIYNTTAGEFQIRQTSSWVTMSSGSTQPDASTTVAGKVEIATAAEMAAGTGTGGTGALLVPPNSQLVKTSSGAGDENKLGVLGSSGTYATGFLGTGTASANTILKGDGTWGSSSTDISTTAKEAITDGKPTAWSSTSNQVENLINSSFSSGDAGSEVAFDTGTVTLIKGCQAAANKVAVIYQESSQWFVIAGTVATDTKVITWGTRQSISANSANILPGATYLAEDAVVFTFVDSSNVLQARAATLSGTVFTFDTVRQVHAATVDACSVSTVDTNKVLFCFNDSVTFGRTSIGTLVAGVLTVDTANEQALFAANAISQISTCKAATGKGFVAFRDNTSQDCTQVAISCGSTTPAPGSAVVADANNCTSVDCSQITTDSVLVVWNDATSTQGQARVASIAGTVVTNPTAELAITFSNLTDIRCLALSTTKAIITLQENTGGDSKAQMISISGTTLALVGAQVTFNANTGTAAGKTAITQVNGNAKFMILYSDAASTNDGKGIVYQDYSNTDRYAGIAQSTVAAAAALSVRQIGTDDAQTGLTVGTIVSSNGIPIGKAVTTTSMEVIVPPGERFGLDTYGTDLSDTDAYVVNLNPAPTAYTTGMEVSFKAVTANTGAATLNVNGLGVKDLKKVLGGGVVALATGDIIATQIVVAKYDGTQFQLVGRSALGGTRKLLVDRTNVNIDTSTTLTTLKSVTVLGGSLGTNNAIRCRLFINGFSLTAGATCAFHIVYGGSTLTSTTIVGDAGNTIALSGISLDCILVSAGATNSQEGMWTISGGARSFDNAATSANAMAGASSLGTAAEDSTTDLTLAIKAQFSAATGSDTLDCRIGVFELIS